MKENSGMINAAYAEWLQGISLRYRRSQIKAATAVFLALVCEESVDMI